MSLSGTAFGTTSPMRIVPWGVRTSASPVRQYLMAAAGSLPGEPKLPCPSTSGARIDHGWAIRTKVS